MRILGIDPGLAITGYGVIDGMARPAPVCFGGIRTPAGMAEAARLRLLYDEVRNLMRELSPDVLAIEELFFNKNTRSAMAVGQARGVILLAAAQAGLDVCEFAPLQVKLAITGQGRAAKEQVGYMVKALLALDEVPRPDDVADALAVALACAQILRTQRRWGDLRP